MLAFLLLAVVIVAPFVLWITGVVNAVVFIAFLVFFGPSILIVAYHSIKVRKWPKIVGGPGINWGGPGDKQRND
ncbi:MAG: hypothetical protein WD712_01810 [Candidatus Spechtbacterales bacterium]